MGDREEMGVMMGLILFQLVYQFFWAVVVGTVGVIIGVFFSSAVYHVFLMMLGGNRHSFDTTFSVVAYATGSASLLQVIPLCGQYVYGIVGLVYTILGLSAAHQISGGKAAAAVLLPLLVCMALMGLVIGAVIAYS